MKVNGMKITKSNEFGRFLACSFVANGGFCYFYFFSSVSFTFGFSLLFEITEKLDLLVMHKDIFYQKPLIFPSL